MYRILAIDGDLELQSVIRDYLTGIGYSVVSAGSGMEGAAMLNQGSYDCVILEAQLPDIDGCLMCESIRKSTGTPILFFSSLDREADRIRGLAAGADAYLSKSCSLTELGVRIYACIRRNRMQVQKEIPPCTNVMCNQKAGIITINGINLSLTAREYQILELLVKEPGRSYSGGEINEWVWGRTTKNAAAVRTYIRRLRKKLGSGWMGTIVYERKWGYYYLPYDGQSSDDLAGCIPGEGAEPGKTP